MNLTSFALAFSGLSLLSLSANAQVSTSADFELRFDATWSNTSHPTAYPNFAHFSPLIGSTHNDSIHFWEDGGIATNGIEVMAESGSTGSLTSEINAAIGAGTSGPRILGAGILSPASTTLQFTATETHSLLTLVTMIAPSPDWFLGVDGLSLKAVDGTWIDSMVVDLYAWDAGTDSGPGFNSQNQNTNPAEAISLLTAGPFFGTTPLGTFTIKRVSGASYCTAKVNSQGCTPSIDSTGSASMTSGSPFNITAMNVVNNKSGLLFYGLGSNDAPFQGGMLCVQAPFQRTTIQNSGGNAGPNDCSGSYSFDMNALIQSGADSNLSVGTRVFTQYWSRDPQSPSGTGLTNGLDFVICP